MDPFYRDTKSITAEQYHRHLSPKALDTGMDLSLVNFVSNLVRWVDDTYEYLLAGGNSKEYVWSITTRVIRSIFEDYMVPARATPIRTSFVSDSHRRSTLVGGVIHCHMSEEKMV